LAPPWASIEQLPSSLPNSLDNLFEPIDDNRVKGDFIRQSHRSIFTWINTPSVAQRSMIAAIAVTAFGILSSGT